MSSHRPSLNLFKWNKSQPPVSINPSIVASDQEKLLLQLKTGPLPQRASAAAKLSEGLSKYSLSSTAQVWYGARDMLGSRLQSYIRRTAVVLMIECIRHQDVDSTASRVVFYGDIVKYWVVGDSPDPEFELFVNAMMVLTRGGRDVGDFVDPGGGLPPLGSVLVLGIKALSRRQGVVAPLAAVLELCWSCVRYNGMVLGVDTVGSIGMAAAAAATAAATAAVSALGSLGPTAVVATAVDVVAAAGEVALSAGVEYGEGVRFLCLIGGDGGDGGGGNTDSTDLARRAAVALADLARSRAFYALATVLADIVTGSDESTAIRVGAVRAIAQIAANDVTALAVFVAPLAQAAACALLTTEILRLLDAGFGREAVSATATSTVSTTFHLWNGATSLYDVLTATALRSTSDIALWQSVCLGLQRAYEDRQLTTSADRMVACFSSHYREMAPETVAFVAAHYRDRRWCTVIHPRWSHNCRELLNYFYYGAPAAATRLTAVAVIHDALSTSYLVLDIDQWVEIVVEIVAGSAQESDPAVVDAVMDLWVAAVDYAPADAMAPLLAAADASGCASVMWTGFCRGIVHALVSQSTKNPAKAVELYHRALAAARASTGESPSAAAAATASIILLRGLMRLRATHNSSVYFTHPQDMEGLAAELGRADPHTAPYGALWRYPETVDYITPTDLDRPNRQLRVGNESTAINPAPLLDLYLDIATDFVHWEVYCFMWCHLCPQLANTAVFAPAPDQIHRLRGMVCAQLMLRLPPRLRLPPGVLKSHLQVVFVRTLLGLLGYHRAWSKPDHDDVIRALLFGLDSWEHTAIPCVHILTVCCYELPASMRKYLGTIVAKLQTKVTSTTANVHMLEFLMAVITVPALTEGLDMDDVRRIFAVGFKFIERATERTVTATGPTATATGLNATATGLNATATDSAATGPTARPRLPSVDSTPSTTSTSSTPSTSPALLHYVLALSYNVILTWFLKVPMGHRRQLSLFILQHLAAPAADDAGRRQQVAMVDLITGFTYNDVPLRAVDAQRALDQLRADAAPSAVATASWAVGPCVVTISTNELSGDSVMVVRKPTGISVARVQLEPPPPLSATPMVAPSHFLLLAVNALAGGLAIAIGPGTETAVPTVPTPIPLTDDPATTRALAALDRTPVVEFHKIGVVYIGPGQRHQNDILANRAGSRAYHDFVASLGSVVRLKDCRHVYAGGLDTSRDTDGRYAVAWADKTVQVLFHTATLMANLPDDPTYNNKKRHIGNNYVNIYFDESGNDFDFNVIDSQFNFINVVISPSARLDLALDLSLDLGLTPARVKVYRRHGVPPVFAACHFKLISPENLGPFVRSVAITANQFAHVWHAGSHEVATNWTHRVRQIDTIADRARRARGQEPDWVDTSTTQSILDQLR